ncbi:MAG: ABC transporter substrate-binding protein [Alphaproteobacteria bacterium]|nr:ABC transporter substrate-binding protein [Alphaproteobacteria bacterium]
MAFDLSLTWVTLHRTSSRISVRGILIGRMLIGTVALLTALFLVDPAKAQASTDLDRAKQVVEDLGSDAIAAIGNGELSQEELADRFREILNRGFNMDRIARFVLGRHWRTAKPDEQERYLKLFREFVVRTYIGRFDQYSGEVIQVTGAREQGKYILVDSIIRRPTANDVTVEWRMQESEGAFKVIDVVVEGVSMGITQRADFDSIIQRQGGSLSALNDVLQDRLNQ